MAVKNDIRITLVISSLTSGGAERVMSQLANHAAAIGFEVSLIILSKKGRFYHLHPNIQVIEPSFAIDQMPRIVFQWKDFWWLRRMLKQSVGEAVLSFGGKYNAFVLLASIGLGKRVFISDRSRPTISYGKFLDLLNPRVYRLANGIIAQTRQAKTHLERKTHHQNIRVIPNPVRDVAGQPAHKEKRIINVGRFIASKHQYWLLQYFAEIPSHEWSLHYFGEGEHLQEVKDKTASLPKASQVHFHGTIQDIDDYYQQAAIFAFTSTSEGFPNALGEAMSAGCACLSFDCEAGPADLIEDGVNGFLVPVGDHEQYKVKLQQLMGDEDLRYRFGKAAQEKMKLFSVDKIAQQYLDFMLSD